MEILKRILGMTTVEIVTVTAAIVGIFGQLAISLRLAYFAGQQNQKLDDHGDRIIRLELTTTEHNKRISDQKIDIARLQQAASQRRTTDR